jgi:hypothetical protein
VFKISHIGLAASAADKGWFETVEGNTNAAGSRDGGGTWRKNRRVSEIRSRIRLQLK